MDWIRVVTLSLMAALTIGTGTAQPAAGGTRDVGGKAVTGQLVVAPAPGRVLRGFEPPATAYGAGHRGVDLAAGPGEAVGAAMAGTVTFAGTVAGVGWVTVDHGGGLETTYGPVEPQAVAAGWRVDGGQVLGWVAEGAGHLDWGAKLDDDYIDPLRLLGRWRVRLVPDDAPPVSLVSLGGPRPAAAGRLRRPVAGTLTSAFGPRRHPITGQMAMHSGADLAAPAGTSVQAAAGGRVAAAGSRGGYGLTVDVDHGGGLVTVYAHLSRIDVRVGAAVTAGQRIGAVGATGVSTGAHLHFEVRLDGEPQDPARWLAG